MNKWKFKETKIRIIKFCTKPNWAEDDEEPILETTIDEAISIANDIQRYFKRHKITIDKPCLCQCDDGSIDLNFESFKRGYNILYNYHPTLEDSVYGSNQCRNWENSDKVEIKQFDNTDNRSVLGLFAKWCKIKNIDWWIEVR